MGLKKALSKLDLTVLRTRAIIRQPAQELKTSDIRAETG